MKKLTALILAGTLTLTLCACSRTPAGTVTESGSSNAAVSASLPDLQPDSEIDAMTLEELRENNGSEISVTSGVSVGAFIPSREEEFWSALAQGYERTGELSGARMIIRQSGAVDEATQRAIAGELFDAGAAVLAISPLSDNTFAAMVSYAMEQGAVTLNVAGALIPAAEYYVGPNSTESGRLAAEWISNRLGDQGQVAVLTGMNTQYLYRQRTTGFEEWIPEQGSSLELVDEQNADADRQTAREIAAGWIQQYPGLRAIFCCNDTMAIGAAQAVREAGADILVVGVGGSAEARESIRAGVLSATVDPYPYYIGLVAGECALRTLAGQWLPRVITTSQGVISAENVDVSQSDLAGWTPPTYITP